MEEAGSKRIAEESANLKRELELAKKAARVAGEILRTYWKREGLKVGSKGRDNPVTQADLEADAALKKFLREPFPAYGWLSEETADNDERLKCSRLWIVDPLDGTKEFITGIPEFAVAIALIENERAVLGVTYNPIKREMIWGAVGAGCYLNTQRARVTKTRTLKRATVLASRSETARGEWKVFDGMMKVKPMGSVAYKLAMVAAGKADATFTRSPKSEWDIASGAALVVAAGGTITDADGRELRFNQPNVKLAGLIADNKLLHEELVKAAPLQPLGDHRKAAGRAD